MKHDTQHLDYLISQYVDGCLDPASRKSLEQQLIHNPSARDLYKGHREVQDMLDEWGNRIPMIDWADFDKKLASRLENETVGSQAQHSIFRRLRPLAAAAALVLAAGVGYACGAYSTAPTFQPSNIAVRNAPAPQSTPAVFEGQNTPLIASKSSVQVDDAPGLLNPRTPSGVAVLSPENPAIKPVKDPARFGLGPRSIQEAVTSPEPGSVSAVIVPPAKPDTDAKDPGPSFP